MVAALLRSLNSGIQDNRLLPPQSSPQIHMFLKAFIRCGRFTTQFTRLDFDIRPKLGGRFTLTIPRKGHLLSRLYLVTTMPNISVEQKRAQAICDASGVEFAGPTFGWTNSLGHALISEASIDIGGARCDRLDGRLLEVLDEFYTPLEKTTLMNTILPRKDNGFKPGVFGVDDTQSVAVTPLPFWFSSGDSGAFLPIDAIQSDAVVLGITFNTLASLYVSTAHQPMTVSEDAVAGLVQRTSYSCVELPGNIISTVATTVISEAEKVSSNYTPAPGDAYYPMAGSSFYYKAINGKPVFGLTGNPKEVTRAYPVPGVKMPTDFLLGDTYVMAEYIYLDKPEANRFRIADIQIPITQHYPFERLDTQTLPRVRFPLKIPNPTRNLFFYLQRWETVRYNTPFLATRDLSGGSVAAPWWPDASGLNVYGVGDYSPGFSTRESEPINAVSLMYEGKMMRYWTDAPSIFRSLIPSMEMRKSPWVNRYYYTMPFGLQHGYTPASLQTGEANLDKLLSIDLLMELHPNRGSINPNDVPRYFVNVWAETYNILRVYGGRAGLLFAY